MELRPDLTAGGRPALVIDLEHAGFADAVEVGRGGFGIVFRAHQDSLNRTVAVKLLHTDLDTVSRERFFREGKAMGTLSGHPNVVDVLQVGVTPSGRPYIVMPYQSLDSLAARIRREGPVPWAEALRMGVRLAGALECAHRAGTLHRDVKPANILLSDYGEAQLTDFGIARIEGGFETATGAFTGSLSYTAPEVLNGHPPTARSDVYGLAAALFSIIAGRAAFERREGEEIIAQFLRITGQPVPDLRGHGVPDELCDVLERAMAKNPDERPQSAAAFGHELQGIQAAAGQSIAEMALPTARPPDPDATVAAHPDERSPRRISGPLPVRERPWSPESIARGAAIPPRPELPAPPAQARRFPLRVAAAVVTVVALLASVGVVLWLVRPQQGAAATAEPAGTPPVTAAAAWRPVPDAPLARQQVASTVADGTVWVFGGLTDDGPTNVVESFDPTVNIWTTSAIPLPEPLHHAMAVNYRGENVVLGGWLADGANLKATTSAKVWAQRGGGWVELPPLPGPRAAGGAVVVGDKIVVVGGQASGALVGEVDVFDGEKWQRVAPIPTPREHLGVVTDGTYVYAVGGRTLTTEQNSAALERYDPAADAWDALAPMPEARGGIGATFADGRIVVAGGEGTTSALDKVDAFDVVSGTWSALPPLPEPKHGLALATVGARVLALDGAAEPSHTGSTATGATFAIPPRRLQPAAEWRALKDAPLARQFTGATVAGGALWVVGGLTEGEATAKTYAYDLAIDSWKAGPDLPVPLHHVAAVTYRDEVVVIGGWTPANGDPSGAESTKVYRLAGGKWAELPPLPGPRVAPGAAVVGDKIVVVGGKTGKELVAGTVVFDGTTWAEAAPMPTLREHLSAVSDGTYVYAVGGRALSADKNSAALERFDPASGTWETLPDMPTARGGVAAAFFDGRIVAAGGEETTRPLDVVEAFDVGTASWSALPPLKVPRHGMAVAALGTAVVAINGAARPGHRESVAAAEVLDFR